jgi:hypothetical protein
MKFAELETYKEPKVVWRTYFCFTPKFLLDAGVYAWLEFVWVRELQFGPSWLFSDRSRSFYLNNPNENNVVSMEGRKKR